VTTILVLLAAILGLLLVLEILNALFDAVREGIAADMARKEPVPPWLIVPAMLRYLLALLAAVGGMVSLWMHELAHAGAQLLFGGRPRVVLLKNGGYAQSTPWAGLVPFRILYGLGLGLGRGVMCMAPILAGATLLLAALVGLTELRWVDLPAIGRELALHLDLAWIDDLAVGTWDAIADARWWTWPVLVVVALLISPNMTPSSVDYVHARVPLLGYCAAAVICAAVAKGAPGALWLVAPACAVVGAGVTLFTPQPLIREAAGGTLLATGALALAMALVAWRTEYTALLALQAGLGLIAYGLAVAAAVFVIFVVTFLALSLISIRPRTLWYTLRVVPRHLIDLVLPFHTCDACRIHYRGKCEGCGRTPEAAAEPARKAA
jgi:hypothetical protein